MKVCFNLKCSFVFLCIFFSLKIAISAFSHSHIWSKFFHSSEENWLKCFCGGTAKSLRVITAVLWAVVAPRSAPLKSWWHFCRLCNIFFADWVWETSCECVRESNAIVFPLPPHQQARVVSDPTGMLLSGKEIKFSAPVFPKVIMQSLAKTTQERGKNTLWLHRSSRWLSLIECMYLATRKDSTYCAITYQMASQRDSSAHANTLGTSPD